MVKADSLRAAIARWYGKKTMKIVLQELTKRFPDLNHKRQEVTAVDHFSFEIPDGELVSLLGPSGCGKSTTLNMICGLEMPSEGRILFGEDDVTELPPENRGVGMVFQSYALYPHLTVRKNILFPLQNLTGKDRLSWEEMNRRAEEAAELVQITDYLERRPRELSGGQQQRVAIARALVKRPRVLLLDEPLSNLDARLRIQTRAEIRRIQQETGITTVFVTHDQEEAMSISDRMVVMKDGVLQQIGKPQEIYDAPANQFVAKFLGNPPINLFRGTLQGRQIMLDGNTVMTLPAAPRGEGTACGVVVGIRPEGLVPAADGPLCCRLRSVEVMGRDVSVVAEHAAGEGETLRAIVSGEDALHASEGTVRFTVKPQKLFLFDEKTGEVICSGEGRK